MASLSSLRIFKLSNLHSHSARLSALSSIYITPPPCCVCDCVSTLILWPPFFLPWYGPRSSSLFLPVGWGWGGRHNPILLIVPGTGAPSPRHHCSPPLAALHPHLLTPSMPSPQSQLSHTAHYPTATHRPSKSGSISVSRVVWCHAVYVLTPVPARCLHGNPFLSHILPPTFLLYRLKTPSVFFLCI